MVLRSISKTVEFNITEIVNLIIKTLQLGIPGQKYYLLLWWDEDTMGDGVELTDPIPDVVWWGELDDNELLGRGGIESDEIYNRQKKLPIQQQYLLLWQHFDALLLIPYHWSDIHLAWCSYNLLFLINMAGTYRSTWIPQLTSMHRLEFESSTQTDIHLK